jgi:hypothetical protein
VQYNLRNPHRGSQTGFGWLVRVCFAPAAEVSDTLLRPHTKSMRLREAKAGVSDARAALTNQAIRHCPDVGRHPDAQDTKRTSAQGAAVAGLGNPKPEPTGTRQQVAGAGQRPRRRRRDFQPALSDSLPRPDSYRVDSISHLLHDIRSDWRLQKKWFSGLLSSVPAAVRAPEWPSQDRGQRRCAAGPLLALQTPMDMGSRRQWAL